MRVFICLPASLSMVLGRAVLLVNTPSSHKTPLVVIPRRTLEDEKKM